MKKIYFFLLAFCFFNGLNAQIINFPDASFKNNVVNYYAVKGINGEDIKLDKNGDKEIDVIEALDAYEIVEENHPYITDITGIEYFTNLRSLKISGNINLKQFDISNLKNLKYLDCSSTMLKTLNVTGLSNLTYLNCYNNGISKLDLTGLTALKELNCAHNGIKDLIISDLPSLETVHCVGFSISNQVTSTSLLLQNLPSLIDINCKGSAITNLKMSGIDKLQYLDCTGNNLTTLDASMMYSAVNINLSNNYLLNSIFIKNGISETVSFGNNSGKSELKFICADEKQVADLEYRINRSYPQLVNKCVVGSYCTFRPGGITYNIKGSQKWDFDNNGCDTQDPLYPFLKFNITYGNITQDFIADKSGKYNLYAQDGKHILTPIISENPAFFSVLPSTVNIDFPEEASPLTLDFCITANGVHPDLEVVLLPINAGIPGFNAKYKIVYKNKGNIMQSGSINLKFDDAVLDYISSNPSFVDQTINSVNWSFTDLKPFESGEVIFTLNVNDPTETPAINIDDVLKYTVTIKSADTDETPNDNIFSLNQIVVGSLDPNDKTCLEGSIITPSLIGEYVHYLIRFENTGNYAAQNSVVKDMIDLSKFDISTLISTSSSHSYITKISEGNKVEFIFENVNLPFDDANNDGYIAFKIKTLPTLVTGDSFDNEANIYFDYNFPVLTNKATSTFKTTLDRSDFEFSNYFSVYPIPAHEVLNVATKKDIEIQSIAVYDILGQLVIALPNIKDASKIDVSNLRTGNYFLKIKSDKGSSSLKFIKN
nr:T9SS type A sorting domain-containing protein [uncultured Flavobacterium sp.]